MCGFLAHVISDPISLPGGRLCVGGPTRFKARVLAQLEGEDDRTLADSLRRALEAGFSAFSFLLPVRPPVVRTQTHVDTVRQRRRGCRARAAPTGGSLTPGDAAAIATAIEKMHPLWLDEPTPVFGFGCRCRRRLGPPSRATELAHARQVEEDGSTEAALGVESMVPSMRKGKLWLI